LIVGKPHRRAVDSGSGLEGSSRIRLRSVASLMDRLRGRIIPHSLMEG
jgi:hypothetical protein